MKAQATNKLNKTVGVNRPREIIEEVTRLRVFATTKQIVDFLKNEYGLTASVEPLGDYIEVHLNDFRHDKDIEIDLPDDKIAKAILKMFNKIHENEVQAVNVWATEFGYLIVLDKEDLRDQESLEGEKQKLSENSLLYYYYYDSYDNGINDYGTNKDLGTEEDRTRNYNMRRVIKENKEEEELLNRLTKNPDKDKEEIEVDLELEPELDIELEPEPIKIDKAEVRKDASNEALDNRFIWFFEITDEFGDALTEEIDNLEDAINLTDIEGAAILVAYPYIDPDPENTEVELQFADTPGPIILWQAGVDEELI